MSENEKLVEAVNKIFDTLLDDAHDVDLKNVWLLIGPCDKARQAVLRALASSPAPAQSAAVVVEGLYLIWSNEHRAWWRPNSAGYTSQFEKAGRYSREDAIRHSRGRDQEPGQPMPEIAVAERDVIACLVSPLAAAPPPEGQN